ncbi:MAG: RluA family pseudouridine synthase [Candidatus Kapabacteria bacterium]|nr:RluA family pseudouridine synthase [Candidatus Kapabacteria bacterium]
MKEKNEFSIVFEDEQIVVVNKPAGLLTIPDRYNLSLPSLDSILRQKYGEIFIVHRLDRETSGIMVFAKDAESHRHLSLQFQNHFVSKIYDAVVKGIVQKDEIDIDIPIVAHPSKKGLSMPSARGKESRTILKVKERFKDSTWTECNLITGRHHQLRVHVAAIGHPLLVDFMYGGGTEFLLSSIKKKKFNLKKHTEEKPIMNRISMHAKSLVFAHPKTEEKISFEVPHPKDFAAMLNVLHKYSALKTFISY